MLNADIAGRIDETMFFFSPSVSHRMKHIEKKKINEAQKLITLTPKLYIQDTETYTLDQENDDYDLEIVPKNCTVSVKIRNLITEKSTIFETTDLKIRTPYPNKSYIVAGTLVNRKFYDGLSFIPDEKDFVGYTESRFTELFEDYHKSLLIHDFKYSEYVEHNHSSQEPLYDSVSIEEETITSEKYGNRDCEFQSFRRFIEAKYLVAPYEITERWQLYFILNGEEVQTNEIVRTYIAYFLAYRPEYMQRKEHKQIICELSDIGSFHSGNIHYTKFGEVYREDRYPIPALPIKLNVFPESGFRWIHDGTEPPGHIGAIIDEPTITMSPDWNTSRFQIEGQSYSKRIDIRDRNHILVSMIPITE